MPPLGDKRVSIAGISVRGRRPPQSDMPTTRLDGTPIRCPPTGGYIPVFHHREAVREIAAIASAGALPRRGKWRWVLAAFACATLLLAAIGLRRFTGQSAPIPVA